jgi:DNA-binding NarL/FixJ family response regulator
LASNDFDERPLMIRSPRVALLGGQALVLDALAELLVQHGFSVVGRATTAEEGFELVAGHSPDVVLLELQMADEGLGYLRRLLDVHPALAVVGLSRAGRQEEIRDALEAGAAACVLESAAPGDLMTAVRQALHQSVFLSQEPVEPSVEAQGLTARELEVLKLVAVGRSNADVARRLWVTEQTVKFHLSNVYKKLNVANRTEASRYAQRHGLISQDDLKGDGGSRRLAG